MSQGVPILDTVTKPCKVWKEDDVSFHIVITQGLNRQIRRMCETFGYHVVSLRRIRIMNIKLGNLKTGTFRKVTPEEYKGLAEMLHIGTGQGELVWNRKQKK